ncbi:MAG: hypothetical protein A3G75_01460 [Verrucomicrobia bacterium RIFCSPLOWO2_12_FULL_64_8]|nr:MAG: hypothetical protein A3G75_01460 [Verrucomicrobia bacterium RIFCSPLOWO2_12_FULL_64_8]
MTRTNAWLLGAGLLGSSILFAAEPPSRQFNGAAPLEWAGRMARSEMARRGETMFHGGALENVFMRDVKIGRVGEAVLTIDLLYEEGAKGPFKPVVRNVQLERITSSGSPRVMYIRGFAGALIDDIRISDSTFDGVTDPEVVEHAGSVNLRRVTIAPAKAARSLNSMPAPAAK